MSSSCAVDFVIIGALEVVEAIKMAVIIEFIIKFGHSGRCSCIVKVVLFRNVVQNFRW